MYVLEVITVLFKNWDLLPFIITLYKKLRSFAIYNRTSLKIEMYVLKTISYVEKYRYFSIYNCTFKKLRSMF